MADIKSELVQSKRQLLGGAQDARESEALFPSQVSKLLKLTRSQHGRSEDGKRMVQLDSIQSGHFTVFQDFLKAVSERAEVWQALEVPVHDCVVYFYNKTWLNGSQVQRQWHYHRAGQLEILWIDRAALLLRAIILEHMLEHLLDILLHGGRLLLAALNTVRHLRPEHGVKVVFAEAINHLAYRWQLLLVRLKPSLGIIPQ